MNQAYLAYFPAWIVLTSLEQGQIAGKPDEVGEHPICPSFVASEIFGFRAFKIGKRSGIFAPFVIVAGAIECVVARPGRLIELLQTKESRGLRSMIFENRANHISEGHA